MKDVLKQTIASLQIVLITSGICGGLYPLVILGAGQLFTPHSANGSLVVNPEGVVVGSEGIAQGFTEPGYLWPRPSAVDYDAAGAGGSNLSPTSEALCTRVKKTIRRYNAEGSSLLPVDLVTASGSGLDPDITERSALLQCERIAAARGVERTEVEKIIRKYSRRPGCFLTQEPLVNVLLVNLELDTMTP